jgi:hypothetical protein
MLYKFLIYTNGGDPETIQGGQGVDANGAPVAGYENMSPRDLLAAIRANPGLPERFEPDPR